MVDEEGDLHRKGHRAVHQLRHWHKLHLGDGYRKGPVDVDDLYRLPL